MELVILLGALAYTTNTMGYQKGLKEGIAAGGGGGGSITASFTQINQSAPPRPPSYAFQLNAVTTKNFNVYPIPVSPSFSLTSNNYYIKKVFGDDTSTGSNGVYGVFSKTYASHFGTALVTPTGYTHLAYTLVGHGTHDASGDHGFGAIQTGVLDITGYTNVSINVTAVENTNSPGEDTVLTITGGTGAGIYTAGGGTSIDEVGAGNNVTDPTQKAYIYASYGWPLTIQGGPGYYSLTFFNPEGGSYSGGGYPVNQTLLLQTIEDVPSYLAITTPAAFT